ncbi:MAG: decarboxylating 6-phosphogluconate dehydrogenase [Candidatus Kaiserbacteria bacterium]|nr:MAG: decarboxylating 6-phosphogluconate dehydrogenase [Candidatus Kaiserbacteria bacterium]
MSKEIGIIGLGKMGSNMARRLREKGWTVHGYDSSVSAVQELEREGIHGAASSEELIGSLEFPRLLWLMVPAGEPVETLLFGEDGIAKKLSKGDVIIDGGNSFYKDSIARAKKIEKLGLKYIDVGFSGGPAGARNGACLMIGGDEDTFRTLEPLFSDLSLPGGYKFFPGAGAGHFVKMVHNGIEYGMMQSIAEGFGILEKSDYRLKLAEVADIYNHGSVIESRLMGWLKSGFAQHGQDLAEVSGSVGHTGEGEWTAKTAKEMGIEAKVIEESFAFRVQSAKKPSFVGKILSALREQFGGHSVKK